MESHVAALNAQLAKMNRAVRKFTKIMGRVYKRHEQPLNDRRAAARARLLQQRRDAFKKEKKEAELARKARLELLMGDALDAAERTPEDAAFVVDDDEAEAEEAAAVGSDSDDSSSSDASAGQIHTARTADFVGGHDDSDDSSSSTTASSGEGDDVGVDFPLTDEDEDEDEEDEEDEDDEEEEEDASPTQLPVFEPRPRTPRAPAAEFKRKVSFMPAAPRIGPKAVKPDAYRPVPPLALPAAASRPAMWKF